MQTLVDGYRCGDHRPITCIWCLLDADSGCVCRPCPCWCHIVHIRFHDIVFTPRGIALLRQRPFTSAKCVKASIERQEVLLEVPLPFSSDQLRKYRSLLAVMPRGKTRNLYHAKDRADTSLLALGITTQRWKKRHMVRLLLPQLKALTWRAASLYPSFKIPFYLSQTRGD